MVLCLSLTSRIVYVGQFTDGEMEGDRSGKNFPPLETLPGFVEMRLIFSACP